MAEHKPVPSEVEEVAGRVMDVMYKIHKALGPGLLESVYEKCLCYEFAQKGIKFESQVYLPVEYEGTKIDSGLRIDVLVEDKLILELKAVERLLPLHKAQVITYLKLAGKRLRLLVNFNVPLLRDGIQRIVY